MPKADAARRARRKSKEGKTPSTQAGEFVREEMHRVGKGNVKTRRQAIAVGLARARRAGVDVPPNPNGDRSRGEGGAPPAPRATPNTKTAATPKRKTKRSAPEDEEVARGKKRTKRAGARTPRRG